MSTDTDTWTPQYESWRHGGWYVTNVRYPSGAVGCVSRNYPDRKWRIACDDRGPDFTYPNRDAAARAEREIAQAAHERRAVIRSTLVDIVRDHWDDQGEDLWAESIVNAILHSRSGLKVGLS